MAIARLCMALGIRDEPEARPMTRAEARRLIHELLGRRKCKSAAR